MDAAVAVDDDEGKGLRWVSPEVETNEGYSYIWDVKTPDITIPCSRNGSGTYGVYKWVKEEEEADDNGVVVFIGYDVFKVKLGVPCFGGPWLLVLFTDGVTTATD